MKSGNNKRTLLIRCGLIGYCEFTENCECLHMHLREYCEVDC